jgi:hypothetical protein
MSISEVAMTDEVFEPKEMSPEEQDNIRKR